MLDAHNDALSLGLLVRRCGGGGGSPGPSEKKESGTQNTFLKTLFFFWTQKTLEVSLLVHGVQHILEIPLRRLRQRMILTEFS